MFSLLVTLALLAIICGLLYLFLTWNFGYWSKRGFKEPKSYPFVGSFPSQFTGKRNVGYDADDMYRKYKKTENFIGVIDCRLPQILVTSPEYARRVYVSDFRSFHDNEFSDFVDQKKDAIFSNNPFTIKGEEWKERRAEITPGLTSSRIQAVYPVTKKVCNSLVDYIRKEIRVGSPDGVFAKQLALRYTTEVVSDCVLGIEAKSLTDQPTPILSTIQTAFDNTNWFFMYNSLSNLMPIIRKFYLAAFFKPDATQFFTELMHNAISLRVNAPQNDRLDFMNYMLELKNKKHLSLKELTSHTMTFLLDGFETTSLTLTHTLLMLGRYPEIQQRVREEVGNEDLSFEQLSELPYLDACIHEVLRLFPVLILARKLCTQPTDFVNKDGKKFTVQPGQTIIVPVWSIHHDEEIYEDPEIFKPERFLPENGGVKKYRDMGAYLGFGDGPRVCFGMRFALTQLKAGLVAILRNFDVKVNKRTRNDNTLDDTYFLSYLKDGVWIDFSERK